MTKGAVWKSTEVLAWTEGDGPGRPPRAGRGPWLAVGGTLGAVFAGMIFSDTLCPEHQAWVQVLGSVGFVAIVASVVGLLRGAAWAPLFTVVSALMGIAIGLVDAVHAPVRGNLIAGIMGVIAVAAAVLALRTLRLTAWGRQVRRSLRPAAVDEPAPAAAVAAESEPAAEAVHITQ